MTHREKPFVRQSKYKSDNIYPFNMIQSHLTNESEYRLKRSHLMAKYLFLASGGKMPASKEEGAKMMKTWEDWFAAMGSNVVDPGSPLSPVAKIAADGRVNDVPAGAVVNGYMILNAETREEAIRIAQGCPLLLTETEVALFEVAKGM
jgi:hypothetical protein